MAVHRTVQTRARWALPVLALCTAAGLSAQSGPSNGLDLTVADPRLAVALSRLLTGSPSAAKVIAGLGESGLPVTIGTPAELNAPRQGTGESESGLAASADPQLAWVALRVVGSPIAADGRVERAWVVVDVDRIERLNRDRKWSDLAARTDDDVTIALAHELVGHVGSIARSRRLNDFCDDYLPRADQSGGLACSIQMENAVRRELNASFGLRGPRRYAERRSYALDVMNFAGAAH